MALYSQLSNENQWCRKIKKKNHVHLKQKEWNVSRQMYRQIVGMADKAAVTKQKTVQQSGPFALGQ